MKKKADGVRGTECAQALGFWTVGIQYLHMVEVVTRETIKQGNPFVVVSDGKLSLEEYAKQTNWSDHQLVIPLLFDFYHGIEVLLKGFLIATGFSPENRHNLSELLDTFESKFPSYALCTRFRKYIVTEYLPEPLAAFCSHSDVTIDDYYQALKYPVSTNGAMFHHSPLKYHGSTGLSFFEGLVSDIADIRKEAVSLGRSICQ